MSQAKQVNTLFNLKLLFVLRRIHCISSFETTPDHDAHLIEKHVRLINDVPHNGCYYPYGEYLYYVIKHYRIYREIITFNRRYPKFYNSAYCIADLNALS